MRAATYTDDGHALNTVAEARRLIFGVLLGHGDSVKMKSRDENEDAIEKYV